MDFMVIKMPISTIYRPSHKSDRSQESYRTQAMTCLWDGRGHFEFWKPNLKKFF